MDQMQSFIEKAKNDSVLMDKLSEFDAACANGAEPDEIVTLAAEYGFAITKEDYRQAVKAAKAGAKARETVELKEEDLEAVAGGGFKLGHSSKCFFLGWQSSEVQARGSDIWAMCDSECQGILFCYCYKSNHCDGRWHKMTLVGGAQHFDGYHDLYRPAPLNEFNHNDPTKQVVKKR